MNVHERLQVLAKAIALGDMANAAMDLDALAGELADCDADEIDDFYHLRDHIQRGRSEAEVVRRRDARRVAALPRLLTPMQQAAL